jgi:hypothetical protein
MRLAAEFLLAIEAAGQDILPRTSSFAETSGPA